MGPLVPPMFRRLCVKGGHSDLKSSEVLGVNNAFFLLRMEAREGWEGGEERGR